MRHVLDLSQRSDLRAFLTRHGIAANKRLGQHFLCSPAVTGAIVSQLAGFKGALEIGPGPGTLTQALCRAGLEVTTIELDESMRAALEESAPCARVLVGDALRVDWRPMLEALPSPKAVVSNMPYQITGPLLGRASQFRDAFDLAVLMMQLEVGERVLAPPGDRRRGALSVALQAQFDIGPVCEAPPEAFVPPPQVKSVVLAFVPRERGVEGGDEALFAFVRSAFRMPRKTLLNNLAASGIPRDRGERLLAATGIEPKARPSDLSLEEWRELWKEVRKE